MRVEWRFALMESGEQFAMTAGMIMMLPLFVDNLDTLDVSHHHRVIAHSTFLGSAQPLLMTEVKMTSDFHGRAQNAAKCMGDAQNPIHIVPLNRIYYNANIQIECKMNKTLTDKWYQDVQCSQIIISTK